MKDRHLDRHGQIVTFEERMALAHAASWVKRYRGSWVPLASRRDEQSPSAAKLVSTW